MNASTGFGTVTLSNADLKSNSKIIRSIMRVQDRRAARLFAGYVAHLDGKPLGALNLSGPSSFPVPAGDHVLEGRFSGMSRVFHAMPVKRWVFPAFEFTLSAGDHLALEFASPAGRHLVFRDPSTPKPKRRRLTERPTRAVLRKRRRFDESSATTVAENNRASTPSVEPEGSVRLTGNCRLELRRVEPVPFVARGTTVTWNSSQLQSETTDEAKDPIQAKVDVNLGPIRLSLAKQLGLEPSRQLTQEQERQLTLPLVGNVSQSWEVRVYDVWLSAEYVRAGQPPVEFEYLSMPTASAFPVQEPNESE